MNCQMQKNSFVTINDEKTYVENLVPLSHDFRRTNDAVYAPLWCIRKVGEAG